jgi:hypothetical protein
VARIPAPVLILNTVASGELSGFALSLGQCFVKGQALGMQLWPEK